MTTATETQLTPVELRNGRWYKREDRHCLPSGVNGSKLRACQHLISRAKAAGASEVISAASVLSPQSAMAAAVSRSLGLPCTIILGATKPESARRHPSIALALAEGAQMKIVPVGFNPYLQRAARLLRDERPGSYLLNYGITTAPDASTDEVRAFHAVGADQVTNLPPEVETLVVPFGSGNSAANVLYGLTRKGARKNLRRVVLVGIGPDRRAWLKTRCRQLGIDPGATYAIEHLDLHGTGYATYAQKMPGTADGITLHPTYEGKVVRYLDEHEPQWWTRRDGSTALWIVGGPLPAARR